MIVNYRNDKLELYFKYDLDTIETIKTSLIGRKWDSSRRCWVVPFSEDNLLKIKALFLNVKYSEELLRVLAKEKNNNPLSIEKISQLKDIEIEDFNFITEPFRYQKIAFEYSRKNDSVGLFMDMGLGKTKITIDTIRYRLNQELLDKVLILCPNNLIDTWLEEFEKHSYIKQNVIGILNGKNKSSRLKVLEDKTKFIYLLNYEGLLVLKTELAKVKWDMIVCDESTYIKNYKAQRTKVLINISKNTKYRMILTGTPTGNSVVDIFGQFLFLDKRIFGTDFYAFRNTYCVMGGYMQKKIVAIKEVKKLTDNIAKRCIRFNKRDCLDLPPMIPIVRKIEMSEEQRKIARQIIDESLVMIDNNMITTTREAMKQTIKLSQLMGGFVRGDDGLDVELKTLSPKIEELKQIINESGSNRIIIWCSFVKEVDILKRELSKTYEEENVFAIDGSVKRIDRKPLFDNFKTQDENQKIFIMTINIGAFGLNLQISDFMIYYSNSYKYLLRAQSLERNMRPGQKAASVTVVDLLIKDSIDEEILKALSNSKNLEDIIQKPLDFFRRLKDVQETKAKSN